MLQGGAVRWLSLLTQSGEEEPSQAGSGGSSGDLASVLGALWQIAHCYLDLDFHLAS